MPKYASVQLHFWEQDYIFPIGEIELAVGDKVIVRLEGHLEVGVLRELLSEDTKVELSDDSSAVMRKVTDEDEEKLASYEEKQVEALNDCRKLVRKHDLQMKLVGAHFSFDGSKIIFTFTAEARVDFRGLVRDLTKMFQKSIRLQQIGSRDEAKMKGGMGICGQEVCCTRFLDKFTSITTDLARVQQMSHRGSERISGICGRLMCCLNYEADQYRTWLENMPPLGKLVKTKQGKGQVIDRNLPKQTVRVRLDDKEKTQIEVPLKEIK